MTAFFTLKTMNRIIAVSLILAGLSLTSVRYKLNRTGKYAGVLIEHGQIYQALAVAEYWYECFPAHTYLGHALGRTYLAAGDLKSAIATLETVCENGFNSFAVYHLGLAYENAFEWEKAVSQYQRILDYSTSFPMAETGISRVKAMQVIRRLNSETPAAIQRDLPVMAKTVSHLLEMDPDNAAAIEARLVITYLLRNRPLLESLIAEGQAGGEIWLGLDTIRENLESERFGPANDAIEVLKSRSAGSPAFLIQLYHLLTDSKPEDPSIRSRFSMTRAEILLAGRNPDKALEILRDARILDPENTEILELLTHLEQMTAAQGVRGE